MCYMCVSTSYMALLIYSDSEKINFLTMPTIKDASFPKVFSYHNSH